MSGTIYQFLLRTVALTVGAYVIADTTGNITLSTQGNVGRFVAYEPALSEADTTGDSLKKSGRSPRLDWQDYYRNRFTDPRPRSSYYLDDPTNIGTTMRLDSTGRVVIEEDVKTQNGSLNYRPSESVDLQTYNEMQRRRAFETLMREYSARLDGKSAMGGRGLLPKLDLPPALDKLLGQDFSDFKPNGFVALDFGVLHQFIDNPSIPIRQRRNTNFIFNEQININFNAKIGDKLGFLTNFDTKASFNFENALKLNYKAPEESLVRKLEAGNISWPINSQLIPGVQNLFGAKAELQFGRLNATFVGSVQRSRKERRVLRGGAQTQDFEIRADFYDENRHFFLAQYFRNIYGGSLKSLPAITSGVTITRLEVYVTNRTTNTQSLRNLAAFADLGEPNPYKRNLPAVQPIQPKLPADNESNGLYRSLRENEAFRQVDRTTFELTNTLGLEKSVDFEVLRGAKRLLGESEYRFNPQLGYLSLTVPLRNDEVLAVAYEYTLNGRAYKVGELTEDYQNRSDDEVIALKLLKSSTIRNNTQLPMWDLMMKNVYALGTNQIDRQGFQLRVIYKDDLTGIDNPNLQEGRNLQNKPLLRVMGLDRLNPVNDLQPDGNFDFVEGITIDSRTGRVFFPVLEPFGSNLAQYFDPDEDILKNKYVFPELYNTTQIDAQQINERNKFYLKGAYQSAGGAEVQLPYGVSEESVTVTSGGVSLSPGVDFIVEAQIGRVRIINPSVLNSGREIVIEFERPDLFNNQIRTLFGTRLDYLVNNDISIGATVMNHRETPAGFLTRVAIGNEPTNNTIVGFDANIRKDAPFLTKWLDKLPLLQTKEPSSIQFKGEVAKLFPGVSPLVNDRSLVDDFEAARTIYDLTRQPTRWRLGSTPQQFPQGSPDNPLEYGFRRAKIAAYTVDNLFQSNGLGFNLRPPNITPEDVQNFYVKLFLPQDLFPGRSVPPLALPQNILDIAYYPSERGMYNYNPDLDNNGRLKDPRRNFGAISRAVTSDIDFDNANIENIEFWLMDPFIGGENGAIDDGFEKQNNTTGGKLVFNLGDISEDVVPDGRFNFENGLPVEPRPGINVDSTAWGRVTKEQFIINAFSNEAGAREKQDVGLDGLNSQQERVYFKERFLDRLPPTLTQQARDRILADPSGDDFQFYLGEELDIADAKILERYKEFLGMEGNSPESTASNANAIVTPASTNLPDSEDLNVDNTVNDNEAYYEYEIDLKPNRLDIGQGFIVDKTVAQDGSNWYLFRMPVKEFTRKVGQINGFKSIRFVRMYLTDFPQPVVLRFAQLQMVGQQYRKYLSDLDAPGLQEVPEPYDARFTVGTVSIEENSQANNSNKKYVYAVPPGWKRDRDITQPTQNFQLNEQSMSLCVTDLRDGDSRAVYKNVNIDMQFRKRLRMYIHMHNDDNQNGQTGAFFRLGTDLTQNYYEIEIANLQATPENISAPDAVWPEQNEMNVAFADLIDAKAQRNRSDGARSVPYSVDIIDQLTGRPYRITVVGNPDLSAVRVMMIGMRNPKTADEQNKSFCLWVNELHVEGFDQTAGEAAVAQLNAKLADFATVTASGRIETFGFGSVQQRIGERARSTTSEFGISSNIQVDKLLPQQWGFSIPLYVNYDRRRIVPHFNPLDPDTELTTSLENLDGPEARDRFRRLVEDNTVRRGINLSNVRKVKTKEGAKTHFYDFENLAFTYAYSDMLRTNILTQEYSQRMYRGGVAYTFSAQPKAFEPFRKWETESRYLNFIKDFNLTLLPTQVSVRADVDRSFTKTQLRNSDLTTAGMQPFYEKYFWFNRYYDLNWNLTRNVVLQYNTVANAIIDEPQGDINTEVKQDSLWDNFKKLGRIKNFDQRIRLTYRLPLDKLPLTDWIRADYNHTIAYNFQANALGLVDSLGIPFGNIVRNSRERGVTGQVDFVALYNKLKYLRFANSPSQERKNFARSPGDIEDLPAPPSKALKNIARVLMTVRGINFSYTVLETTALPGFLPTPLYFGLSDANAPGLPFVLGNQDRNIHVRAAENGWITPSEVQNQPFQQTVQKNFNFRTTLEPFKDFRMQIEGRLTRQDAYQEFYRPDAPGGSYLSQSPVRNGQFSMSFLSFRTAFAKMQRDNESPVFDRFRDYRTVLKDRLNQENNSGGEYNENSQDVLIPAFFAAYTGKDPNTVRISPFLGFPMPNWRIDYNGLSQVKPFQKLFSSFTLTHNYNSTYSVGNFTSSLGYEALYVNLAVTGYPLSSRNNYLGQYVPVFVMSTVTMQEKFSPLVGVNFRTQSRITGRVDYNRDRTIALNLANSQVAELFNQDLTIAIGFTKNNVAIPFKINGVKKKLKNDLIFNFSMTFRDTRSIQRKFDGQIIPVAGNINFQLRPTLAYQVNNRLNVQFYFDRTFNDPLVTNSFYRSTTAGGVQVKFNLAE
ncbi:T9SS outer membrane translocon Sov/SprA [Persicitalea jodogahamensis]|uniref:Cell surface protein SprA n=1 Tax=Persicitalea jodogahamensis TaxID=402147 RepID=A0A8J3GAC4_9BACT|nr:cell surface protein SprA [Persicitalea jodogahamensis]GHB73185.1 cell surface protein SprA [Persicitalea jodogahamensis]